MRFEPSLLPHAMALRLSLWILERSFGEDRADQVAEILEYERLGGIFHHP